MEELPSLTQSPPNTDILGRRWRGWQGEEEKRSDKNVCHRGSGGGGG